MGAGASVSNRGVRLAELLATVSLASDLAHDVLAESAVGGQKSIRIRATRLK
jgi:hypothetical protein